jgi:hypothetical protein
MNDKKVPWSDALATLNDHKYPSDTQKNKMNFERDPVADIKNKLSPFFTLVEMVLANGNTNTPSDIAPLITECATTAKENMVKIVAMLDFIRDRYVPFNQHKTSRKPDYILRFNKFNDTISVDIDGDNICYCSAPPTYHGLQCNHVGGTPEHDEILELCSQISQAARKVFVLNKESLSQASEV